MLNKGMNGCLAVSDCLVSVFIDMRSQPSPAKMQTKGSGKKKERKFLRIAQKSETWQEDFHRLAPNNPVCKYLSHLLALLNTFLALEITLLFSPG